MLTVGSLLYENCTDTYATQQREPHMYIVGQLASDIIMFVCLFQRLYVQFCFPPHYHRTVSQFNSNWFILISNVLMVGGTGSWML